MTLKPPCGYIAMPVGIGWIIRARGLAPSIGAGGTIVVAGLCALLFVSALLTFRAWPERDGSRPDGALSLRVPELKAAGRAPAPRPASSVAATAARAPSGAERASRPRPRAATPRAAFRAPAPAPAASGPAPAARPAPAATTRPATAVRPVTTKPASPAPGPLESTVAAGRETVQQVPSPVAPPPVVQQPVDQALGAVQDTARTVDGIVKPLLP